MPASAFEGFLSTPAMLALFEPASLVQAMLDVEAALMNVWIDASQPGDTTNNN